ncbi:hypothetical protein OUZ56_015008 [Daphnia magna]|uniref:Uncharacterized protein n=1 Tax=Daphnia magna TaxID=35525 RepID=A0ABR0ALH8_9CRUS|nr:hypothetical protein OUZ56_015008 [Daphnia magna]
MFDNRLAKDSLFTEVAFPAFIQFHHYAPRSIKKKVLIAASSSPLSSPLPWPSSHRHLHLCLGHRLIAVFAFAFSIVSSPSSPLPSPSSHRRLRLCLLHHLIAVFAFAFSIISSPSSPLPSPSSHRRLRHCRRLRLYLRHCPSAVFAFALHGKVHRKRMQLSRQPTAMEGVHRGSSAWDRALFCPMAMGGTVAAPLGAVGNAPVGTSLCRRGDRFPGVCIPGMVSITVPARTCLRTSPILFAILLT